MLYQRASIAGCIEVPSLTDEKLQIRCFSTATHPTEERLNQALDGVDDVVSENVDSLAAAYSSLEQGECDIMAAPANLIYADLDRLSDSGLEVLGALRQKHPFHVMVADERIDYLPKSGIILVEERLLRRQMRRRRRGLELRSISLFSERNGLTPPDDQVELFNWLEALRGTGVIDGFIVPRTLYESAGSRSRRHALIADPEDRGVPRFLPVPFADLSVLVARRGLPYRFVSEWADPEGWASWTAQTKLLATTPAELHDRIGLLTRHRQLGTLLNEADRLHDLFVIDSEINPEGEVIDDQTRIEIAIELISSTGRRTICVERVQPLDDFSSSLAFICQEWKVYLDEGRAPHDESVRLGPARPAFLYP